MAALADHFRVYQVDLMGFGRSRSLPFALDRAELRVAEWLDSLHAAPFHLIGHSMGGLISAQVAMQAPELVKRLVLVDAVAVSTGRTISGSAVGLLRGMRYTPRDFYPILLQDALRAGPVTLLRATFAIHRVDISTDLEKIQAPTLIVWGEHDTLLPVALGQALHRSLPQSELVVLSGAGHNAMWDRAAAFNQVVLRFLSADERRPA